MVVDLVTMAVTLRDARRPVDPMRKRTGDDIARLRAQAHRAAQIGAGVPPFDRTIAVLPLGDQRDDRMRRRRIELGAVGMREARHVSRVFDDGKLHAEADAEVGNVVLARIAYGGDLPLDAALAETAGDEHGIHAAQAVDAVALDRFGVDVVDVDLRARVDAGVDQCLR